MRVYPLETTDDGVVLDIPPKDTSTRAAARDALEGRTHGIRALLPFLGPAFIACVAYIDPGNFATNIQGGSAFGYNLLWVIFLANLMAMVLQTLSAKLGLATGKNLAEMCREHFAPPVVYAMWIVAEVGAMATDLAEFLGASLGFYLLFGIPLIYATLHHRGDYVPHPALTTLWLSTAGSDHYRASRRHRAELHSRNDFFPPQLGAGRLAYGVAMGGKFDERPLLGWHHRRDGHAPCASICIPRLRKDGSSRAAKKKRGASFTL